MCAKIEVPRGQKPIERKDLRIMNALQITEIKRRAMLESKAELNENKMFMSSSKTVQVLVKPQRIKES
jgi:hypothetical protein